MFYEMFDWELWKLEACKMFGWECVLELLECFFRKKKLYI